MIDLTLSTVGAGDPRVAGVADDAGAAAETGGAQASFASALAAYAGDDSPEGESTADGAPEENLDAASAAVAAAMSAAVTPVIVTGPFGLMGSSIDEGDHSVAPVSAATPVDVLGAATSSAGREVGPTAADVVDVTGSSRPVETTRHVGTETALRPANQTVVEVTGADRKWDAPSSEAPTSARRPSMTSHSNVPQAPATAEVAVLGGEPVVPASAGGQSTPLSANSPQASAPAGIGVSSTPPVASGASAIALPAPVPASEVPTEGARLVPPSDTVTPSAETVAAQTNVTGAAADLDAMRTDETPVAHRTRHGLPAKAELENTPASGADRSLPAAALTGELVDRAMETSESGPARTETANAPAPPSPYHMRVAFAATADGGWNDGHSGGSRDGTTFGFGGHAASSQLLPALKLAGASFANALASVPVEDGLPAQTATQIVQSLKLQWARGGGDVEIRLEPHHFGELRISMKIDDGRVHARLEAEAPVVREWLQTNQAALKSGLADQNLTLDRFEVVDPKRDARDRESAEERHRENQPKTRRDRRRRDHGGELFEVVA